MRRLWFVRGFALVAALFITAGCANRVTQPESAQQAPAPPAAGGPAYTTPPGARLSSGALYQVGVIPERWNGDIIVYVPGYHDPAGTPELPGDFASSAISRLLLPLGYAYATTSFRGTGLLQPEWIAGDLLELVSTAKSTLTGMTGRRTRYVYQTGGSQGGLVTVQAVERYPEVFSGGLAASGPIGDYARQIEYVADFRVVFDACFHDVIPSWPVWRQDLGAGNPGTVDPASWSAAQAPAAAAISDAGNARRMEQVLAVTRAPIDRADPSTVQRTALGLLWYSFRGTQDAIAKLNGLAYANLDRSYSGSLDDAALNAGVERFRFTADPSRLATLQTMARLRRPLVTIHTTGDPIVPIWQQELYKHRLPLFSRLLFTPISIQRYGHGNFTDAEILAAFAVLVLRVTGANLVASQSVLPSPAARAQCLEFAARYGAHPILEPGPVSRVSERGAHERMAAQSGTLSH